MSASEIRGSRVGGAHYALCLVEVVKNSFVGITVAVTTKGGRVRHSNLRRVRDVTLVNAVNEPGTMFKVVCLRVHF